jgi:hypothetical protein
MRALQNYLATTGDTEDRRFKPVQNRDFSSASPVSSVVESLILQCALCSFRFVSIVSFVLDQRVESSKLQQELGS